MKSHFAVRKRVVKDERKRKTTAAGWDRKYSAGLDNYFARRSVDHVVGLGTLDFAAGHSCRAVAYHDGHDARPGAQGRMDYSGFGDSDLTSCSVHIKRVKLWNVKSSDRTARTLKPSDRIARLRCGPKSWYSHHLALPGTAHSKDQLHMTKALAAAAAVVVAGSSCGLSSVGLAVYK